MGFPTIRSRDIAWVRRFGGTTIGGYYNVTLFITITRELTFIMAYPKTISMCIVFDYSETSSTGSRARIKVDAVLSRMSTSSVVASLRVLMRVGSLEANEPKCKLPIDVRSNGRCSLYPWIAPYPWPVYPVARFNVDSECGLEASAEARLAKAEFSMSENSCTCMLYFHTGVMEWN